MTPGVLLAAVGLTMWHPVRRPARLTRGPMWAAYD
jgi:hypothetical protein